MRVPVDQPYTITTEFGVPDSNARFGYHSGIDYAVELNRPVHAPASGNLTNVVSATGGNMVVINDGKYVHRLMHNNTFSRSNGGVTEGEQVALAGTTGLSTGVHCHWDINNEGAYPTSFAAFINPNDWLKQEGDDMTISNNNESVYLTRLGTFENPRDDSFTKTLVGKDLTSAIQTVESLPARKAVTYKVDNYDKIAQQLEALQKVVASSSTDSDKKLAQIKPLVDQLSQIIK